MDLNVIYFFVKITVITLPTRKPIRKNTFNRLLDRNKLFVIKDAELNNVSRDIKKAMKKNPNKI